MKRYIVSLQKVDQNVIILHVNNFRNKETIEGDVFFVTFELRVTYLLSFNELIYFLIFTFSLI